MNTAIATLLQLTATFLMGVQSNQNISLAAQKNAVAFGSHVVQLATQDLANVSFPVPQDSSILMLAFNKSKRVSADAERPRMSTSSAAVPNSSMPML